MSDEKLALKKRVASGKKVAELRAAGLIPSIIYGGKSEPVMTESEYNPTEKVLKAAGYHSPVDLEVDGKMQMAMVKNVAIDPVKRRILNVEFQAISANEAVVAMAPIELIDMGTSEAEKLHLTISQVLDEIEVKAKPADLPSKLEISVSGLASTEDKLTLADIKLPTGVEFADKEIDLEQVIANVYDSAVEAAREAEAEAAAAAEAASGEGAEVPAEHGEAAPENTEAKAE